MKVYTIKLKRKMIKGVLMSKTWRKEGWKESIKDIKEGGGRGGGEKPYIHETKRKAKPKNRALSWTYIWKCKYEQKLFETFRRKKLKEI